MSDMMPILIESTESLEAMLHAERERDALDMRYRAPIRWWGVAMLVLAPVIAWGAVWMAWQAVRGLLG